MVYGQGRKRMRAAFVDGGDTAFHKWRIRVKNLYYALQLLEPVWPKRLGKMIARLRKLQEKIGDDHDLTMVKALLEKTPEAFGGAQNVARLIDRLNKRSKKLRRPSKPLGKEIFPEKPRRFTRKLGRHWDEWVKEGRRRSA
jgi:CHAD domain-containing protein